MVKCIRNIEKAKGHLIGKTKSEKQNFRIVRRSIVAIKDIKIGEKFTNSNIGCKRPMLGIPAERWHKVLNKKSKKTIKKTNSFNLNEKKICFISSSRADFGIMRNLIRSVKNQKNLLYL